MRRKWAVAASVVLAAAVVVLWTYALAEKPEVKGSGSGRVLEKRTFIHYRKGTVKPPGVGGGKPDKNDGSYTYLANGAKWKTPEEFRLNLTCGENVNGSLDDVIKRAVEKSLETWETAKGQSLSIFVNELVLDDKVSYPDTDAPLGHNSISFGINPDSRVIAVAQVWGYFGGRPSTREIVEAHIQLNDRYVWGDVVASDDSTLMDLQNILTHELGHAAGMGDLYDTTAAEETMYGYSGEGEIKKRDLYKGDEAGITKLYGN